jgi:uncharacterized protein YggE
MQEAIMRLVTFLTLSACLFIPSRIQAQDNSPKISTSGTATIKVPADHVQLTVGVSARADRAKDAAARVAATLNVVRDALVRLGLDRNSLPSAGYSVNADYNDPKRANGYLASSSLSAELSNLSLLGSVVDAALGAGANEVSDIRFLPKNEEAARARALELAVQRARSDADVLAKAAGTTLGPLILLTTQQVSPLGVGFAARAVSLDTSRATEIPPPEISIAASVLAQWAIAK